jgi:phage terminase large subunit-like protein
VSFELTPAQDRAMDMLISDARHCALGGGSRSGKTFLLVRAVVIRALKAPESRHALFRFRFNAIKASIIYDTLPKVLKLCFPQLPSVESMLNKSDWFLKLPNGSEIWFGGLDDAERVEKILGQEYATIYFNECSQIPWHSVETALTRLAQNTNGALALKAYYDFNPPSKVHWTFLRFVEKKNPESKQPEKNPHLFGFYLINRADNKNNLAPEYLEFLDGLSPKKRDRFLLGRFADDSDGALWTVELLEQNRILDGNIPEYLRIVIAIDPSGCSGPDDVRSDEIGIAVCALGTNGHGYLLEDLSGKYGPETWADIVNEAYLRHNADRVVGEKNFGGDMVRAVLQAKNPDLPYAEVTATRGKVVRAEPISALYEQGKIHHVGYFHEAEDQLCSMTMAGYQGLKSPDRGDSIIWGFTELFPKLTRKSEDAWRPPQVHTVSRSASRFSARR